VAQFDAGQHSCHNSGVNVDHTLRCRIAAPTKARIEALARRRGETASTWLRSVIDRALEEGDPVAPGNEDDASGSGPRIDRISIRLRPGDGRQLRLRAQARCMKPSTYVAALVRQHVGGSAPLPGPELRALKLVLAELSATSRRVRAVPADRHTAASAVAELGLQLEQVRAAVAAVVRSNAESWGRDG
jgi:hypothetical protein